MSDDGIRNVDGAEARMLLAQFFGQVVTPEMRTLRSHTVSDSRNLQGSMIDPEAVVRAIPIAPAPPSAVIPGTNIPVQAIPGTQYRDTPQMVAPQPVQPQPVQHQPITEVITAENADKQLSFNFNYDIAADLIEKIERTNQKIDKLMSICLRLQETVTSLQHGNSKKKPGI